MRLALVRQKYNAAGGAERFVGHALTALSTQHDLDVTLLARRWEGHGQWQQRTVDPFYLGKIWRDASFAHAVQGIIARGEFDLVQSHERIAGCHLYRAGDGVHREWLRQRARAQNGWQRAAVALTPYHHYVCHAERQMFEHPALRAVICISQLVRQDILRHFNTDPKKLHVIINGVDTDRFHPRLKAQRHAVRQHLGIAPEALTLLFVGSGFARKGLAILLHALATAHIPAQLIVVGRDKHTRRYQALAHRLGLATRVHFLGAHPDVTPYYGAADALTLPTLYEPFGNVYLEAMASGLPVLASTTSGGAERVQEGINGYVRDALDRVGIANAIDAFASSAHCAQLGEAARAEAASYTLARYADALESLYRDILKSQPQR